MSFHNLTYSDHGRILSFEIHDVDVCIVNALRRILWNDIQNVGVFFDVHDVKHSDINILTNTSPLHNEFISQRISLIPLYFTEQEIATYDKNRYKFVINKTNTTYEMLPVTTDDIEMIDTATEKPAPKSMRDRIFPRDRFTKEPILITKLKPNLDDPSQGGCLHVEFYASKGTKDKHTCYCAVSSATFHNVIDKEAADEAFKAYDGTRTAFDTLEAQRYFYKNEFQEPSRFRFEIETECALEPKELMTQAFECLLEKLRNVQQAIQQSDPEVVKVYVPSDGDKQEEIVNVTILKESHTLGNVLQCLLYNQHIREKKSKELKYVGYNCPHPLQQVVLLRLAFDSKKNERQVSSFLGAAIEKMIASIDTYKATWNKSK